MRAWLGHAINILHSHAPLMHQWIKMELCCLEVLARHMLAHTNEVWAAHYTAWLQLCRAKRSPQHSHPDTISYISIHLFKCLQFTDCCLEFSCFLVKGTASKLKIQSENLYLYLCLAKQFYTLQICWFGQTKRGMLSFYCTFYGKNINVIASKTNRAPVHCYGQQII